MSCGPQSDPAVVTQVNAIIRAGMPSRPPERPQGGNRKARRAAKAKRGK